MPAVIPIAVAAIAAAGTAGGQAIAAHQAGGGGGGPQARKFPLPKHQRALQTYYARTLARNAMAMPPSFGKYVESGGEAKFPLVDPGFTPKEARLLGFVGRQGQPIPLYQRGQEGLTPEQALYLGSQRARDPSAPQGGLARAYRINQRIGRLLDRPETPRRERRIERLRERRDRIIGSATGAGGAN